MAQGDPGPYVDDEGNVWVPRTVPWSRARAVAREAVTQWGDKLVYEGKEDGTLFGFSPNCPGDCEERCERANRCRVCGLDEFECACEVVDKEDWDVCQVPVWSFRIVEP